MAAVSRMPSPRTTRGPGGARLSATSGRAQRTTWTWSPDPSDRKNVVDADFERWMQPWERWLRLPWWNAIAGEKNTEFGICPGLNRLLTWSASLKLTRNVPTGV